MIKLLWILCAIPVFTYTFKACIKAELDTWEEVSTDTLILFTLLSFFVSLLGPIAIAAFLLYNVFEGIARSINERYKNDTR